MLLNTNYCHDLRILRIYLSILIKFLNLIAYNKCEIKLTIIKQKCKYVNLIHYNIIELFYKKIVILFSF